jgi:hypothetical protein
LLRGEFHETRIGDVKMNTVKKFTGSYEAMIMGDDFMSITLQFDEFPQSLNLNIQFDVHKNEFKPIGLFYMGHPHEWDCPACGKAHWNDEKMKCPANDDLANELWDYIKNLSDFKGWLYDALLEENM